MYAGSGASPAALPEEQATSWRQEITRARRLREQIKTRWDWDGNLDRYAPLDAKKTSGDINIGADFADVERKKAALFYAAPDVSLLPDDPDQPLVPPSPPAGPGAPPTPPPPTLGSLCYVHQLFLNDLLGPDHIDTKGTVLKCLQDNLLVAGVGAAQVGYTAVTEAIDVPIPDPVTGQPQIGVDGMPVTQSVPVPIHEDFWMTRISPAALLLPADFRDTDVRHAAWIGYDFRKPERQVKAWLQLPADLELPAASEDHALRADDQSVGEGDRLVSGTYLEYKASLVGGASHPQAVSCLVFIDGMNEPVKHEPSPHQTIDEQGRLTPDSLRGFSIFPLWIRDLSDSAWVPSDSTITGPLTRELNTFRTQTIEQRDNARHVVLYDPTKLAPDMVQKIKDGRINTFVPVAPDTLAAGVDGIMQQVVTASVGRESYIGQDYIQRDREAIHGISSNQNGATNQTERSATEVSTVQRNTEARFNQEQQRVLDWYLKIVRAIDALVVRNADERFAAQILGPRQGAFWAQFKPALAGGYRHTLRVDSGKYLDVESERRQLLQLYQLTRQDPFINPVPLLHKLLQSWGLDAQSAVKPPDPPQPPPPQVAITLKGEDLSPLSPQQPIAITIARQGGWNISDEIIVAAQQHAQQLTAQQAIVAAAAPPTPAKPSTKHGGPATQQMPLSKRQADETGGISGPIGGVQ